MLYIIKVSDLNFLHNAESKKVTFHIATKNRIIFGELIFPSSATHFALKNTTFVPSYPPRFHEILRHGKSLCVRTMQHHQIL